MARRPRRSLARQTLLWMGIFAVLPSLASAVVFQQLFNVYISHSQGNDADTLASLVARSVSGRLDDQWTRRQGEALDSLSREPHIAFVAVLDRIGKPLHLGVFDPQVWDEYVEIYGPTFSKHDLTARNRAPALRSNRVVLSIAPVHSIEDDQDASSDPPLEGAVLLAMKEPNIRTVMWKFHSAQIGMVLLVCTIALPIMALVMRRWIRPLRQLIEATRRLAMGRPPRTGGRRSRRRDRLSFGCFQ